MLEMSFYHISNPGFLRYEVKTHQPFMFSVLHFSAELKRFLLDRADVEGVSRRCHGGFGGIWVVIVSITAHGELKGGRVPGPA